MDELTRNDEWSRALRGVSEERDRRLGSAPAISPSRRAVLDAALARGFPMEVALRDARARRDQFLKKPQRDILRSVALDLRRRLTNRNWPWWTNFLTRPGLIAACLIAACAIVSLGRWGSPSTPLRLESRVERPVERAQFSLRMNAAELAALRTTFLAANRTTFKDDPEAPTRLRLDLPVEALLGDVTSASTP